MFSLNGYVIVEPLKEGVISNDSGNVYRVVNTGGIQDYSALPVNVDDEIVIEDHQVVRLMIKGEETCFVKGENILAVSREGGGSESCGEGSCCSRDASAGEPIEHRPNSCSS